ncbi:MAG: signal recognition particle-docking protein FtsY [Ilumatobacteraceae bacterium]
MNVQNLILILLVVTLVFGFGVVLLNRRSEKSPPTAVAPTVTEAAPAVPQAMVSAVPVPATGLRGRLGRTASLITGTMLGIRQRGSITDGTWEELEEALLRADVGVQVTSSLLDELRSRMGRKEISDADSLVAGLQSEMTRRLNAGRREVQVRATTAGRVPVVLMVGVNGAGKTTSIGKIAAQHVQNGRRVMLAAGDTFRAAAAEQLETWAERSGADIVRGQEGGDPSAVVFDAIASAASKGCDLVIADTAGRLQNKSNLMDELRKVRRVADREPGEVVEVLLVIDATTGQNGISQAREFTQAVGVSGIVLTKLDGSAKGGVVFAIETDMGIPVKLVGVGEGVEDLIPFDPDDFVSALFAG